MCTLSVIIVDVQVKYSTVIPAIRMDGYDWTEFDSFTHEMLPIGCCIDCESIFIEYFDLRIITKHGSFSGRLSLRDEVNTSSIHISRAVTALYDEQTPTNITLVTVAIVVRPVEPVNSVGGIQYVETVSSSCQTDLVRQDKSLLAHKFVQCVPSTSEASTNTEGHVLGENELQERLQKGIEKRIEEYLIKKENPPRSSARPSDHPADPAHLAGKATTTTQELYLGHNIIPRIQQLTTLDRIITNQKQGVEKLQNIEHRLLLNESVLKKAEQIRIRRGLGPTAKKVTVDTKPLIATSVLSSLPPKPRPPVRKENEKIQSSPQTSSHTTGTSATSESSSDEETSTSVSSSVEKDSPSSPDTVKQASVPLSPTSNYLQELRERILAERINNL